MKNLKSFNQLNENTVGKTGGPFLIIRLYRSEYDGMIGGYKTFEEALKGATAHLKAEDDETASRGMSNIIVADPNNKADKDKLSGGTLPSAPEIKSFVFLEGSINYALMIVESWIS